MSAKIEDLKDERVPNCLYWSEEQVAEWIEEIGFPDYKVCQMKQSTRLLRTQSHLIIFVLTH